MRVQRLRSKLDVVIDLPELGATPVQRVHQLTRRDVDDVAELVVRELDKIPEQDHHAGLERQRRDRALHRVPTQRPARLRWWKSFQCQLIRAAPPEPPSRPQRLTAELGGRAEDVGPTQAVGRRPMTKAVGDLAKRGACDAGCAVNIIEQAGDVIQDLGEVRMELAFYGRGPHARGWSFDVYLIH